MDEENISRGGSNKDSDPEVKSDEKKDDGIIQVPDESKEGDEQKPASVAQEEQVQESAFELNADKEKPSNSEPVKKEASERKEEADASQVPDAQEEEKLKTGHKMILEELDKEREDEMKADEEKETVEAKDVPECAEGKEAQEEARAEEETQERPLEPAQVQEEIKADGEENPPEESREAAAEVQAQEESKSEKETKAKVVLEGEDSPEALISEAMERLDDLLKKVKADDVRKDDSQE